MSNPSPNAPRAAAPAVAFAVTLTAALAAFGVACRELPVQVDPPARGPSRSLAASAAPGCSPQTPTERVRTLREMVAALPPAAALVADARLLPAIAALQDAVGGGQGARVAAAVRTFVADVESLRLRAPFEQREALVAEAECLLGAPAAAGGPPA